MTKELHYKFTLETSVDRYYEYITSQKVKEIERDNNKEDNIS